MIARWQPTGRRGKVRRRWPILLALAIIVTAATILYGWVR